MQPQSFYDTSKSRDFSRPFSSGISEIEVLLENLYPQITLEQPTRDKKRLGNERNCTHGKMNCLLYLAQKKTNKKSTPANQAWLLYTLCNKKADVFFRMNPEPI